MEHCAIRTLTSSFLADHLRAQKKVHTERRQTSRGPGPQSACTASSLHACDGLNVWTHSRGTASAAVPPCRQKDYPVLSEAVDVSSEVDRCARWRRSEFFWHVRATLGVRASHYPVHSGRWPSPWAFSPCPSPRSRSRRSRPLA